MTIDNLWGELPGPEATESRLAILREQAQLLGENTNFDLLGKVRSERSQGYLETELSIQAPALNNYEISLAQARHEALMYPVQLYDLLETGFDWIECIDEAAFKVGLGTILRSPKVQKVIASLLAQVRGG